MSRLRNESGAEVVEVALVIALLTVAVVFILSLVDGCT